MKKLYIIASSWDEYDDHYKVNECVCYSWFLAENKKTEIENKYRKELPFPFSWCTEEEFTDLLVEHKTAPENDFEYFKWLDAKDKQETFNGCFINEIDYYES